MRPEKPIKLVAKFTAVCRRCQQPVPMDDPTGYFAGKAYGFSHCGLVQSAKAPQA